MIITAVVKIGLVQIVQSLQALKCVRPDLEIKLLGKLLKTTFHLHNNQCAALSNQNSGILGCVLCQVSGPGISVQLKFKLKFLFRNSVDMAFLSDFMLFVHAATGDKMSPYCQKSL
jgi:hypothetical protein